MPLKLGTKDPRPMEQVSAESAHARSEINTAQYYASIIVSFTRRITFTYTCMHLLGEKLYSLKITRTKSIMINIILYF